MRFYSGLDVEICAEGCFLWLKKGLKIGGGGVSRNVGGIILIEIRLRICQNLVGRDRPLAPSPDSDCPETRKTCTDKFH